MVGKITVQSESAGSKDALWAEGGEDEECGKGVEEKTEERKSNAARRRTGHLAMVFTRAGLEATLTEMTRCWPCVEVCRTVGVLFIAAVLFGVWLAVAVSYGLGSASGQDPGPRALHHRGHVCNVECTRTTCSLRMLHAQRYIP